MSTSLAVAQDGRAGLRIAPISRTWIWHPVDNISVLPMGRHPPCNRDPVDSSRKCSACRRHTQCLCNNMRRNSMEDSNISNIHNSSMLLRCQCITCKGLQDWDLRLLLCQCICRDLRALPSHRLPRPHLKDVPVLLRSNNPHQCRDLRAPLLRLLLLCQRLPHKVRHCQASRYSCPVRQHRVFHRLRRLSSARPLSIPLL
jgi:hypothetical protein